MEPRHGHRDPRGPAHRGRAGRYPRRRRDRSGSRLLRRGGPRGRRHGLRRGALERGRPAVAEGMGDPQAGDRRAERRGGRRGRHAAAAVGHPAGRREHAHHVRLREAWPGARGGQHVAAATPHRHEPCRRPAPHRTARRRARGARDGARLARRARRGAPADRAGDGARDRRADRAGGGGAHQAAPLGDDGRARSRGGREPGCAGVRMGDRIAGRQGGHPRVPREAPGALEHEAQHRPTRARPLPEAMMQTLGAFLDAAAARAPEREALAWAERDSVSERRTWRQLQDASRFAARKLIGIGVGKGTRVGLLCPNRPEWLPIAFGALRLGAVLVPFSTLWRREEIAYALAHGDVQVLITRTGFLKHDYLADLTALVPELDDTPRGRLQLVAFPALRRVVLLVPGARRRGGTRGVERWHELEPAGDDGFLEAVERAVSPTDVATIFFTSGTTAQAKAVVHAHGALTTSGARVGECLGVTPEDAWWGHMPLVWSGGFIIGALATMAGGGRMVLQEQVDAGSALALLEAERCTIMAGWHQGGPLLEHPDFPRRRLALAKGSYHQLAERLLGPDHHAVGMYGMSETATCVACARWDDPPAVRRETFGKPLPGMDVRVVDPETRQPVAQGAHGELSEKGPTLREGDDR